jgi:hypothetical protein
MKIPLVRGLRRARTALRANALLTLIVLMALVALGLAPTAHAADEAPRTERLQVTDPYIEMRTGPGRGYPVFHVAARAEFIQVELRYTDWYKVRTDNGKEGWVHRRQLQTTLTEAGGSKSFRDIALDDYLQRRLEFGAAWGRFRSEPMLKLWTGYKLSEAIGLEATLGQVQGVFSGTNFWHVNLQSEPWADQRISPFFAIGLGNFKNFPNTSLVGAIDTDAKLANMQLGVRYYLTERFVLRADYTIYTAFLNDNRSDEYKAFTAGVSFFF